MSRPDGRESVWTVPNLFTGLRIVGTVPLLWAARVGYREAVLGILLALVLSDWLDGKLGKLLDQGTELGARLDSAADAVMYAAVAVCFWWLEGDVMRGELPWFVATLASWVLSVTVSLARFGRMPSYHTWGAKVAWLVAAVVSVVWLLTGDGRFVPGALALVIVTNLEAVGLGLVLPEWRVNVPTLVHALRIRSREE